MRSISSPALAPDDLDGFRPPTDAFVILVLWLLGPEGGEGEEAFYLSVCSPAGLAEATADDDDHRYEFVRSRLVIQRWDPALIRKAVEDLCRRTSGNDWYEVATKLSRYLTWEFEDYVEPPPSGC